MAEYTERTMDAELIADARKWPNELEGALIHALADSVERLQGMLQGSHTREVEHLNRAFAAEAEVERLRAIIADALEVDTSEDEIEHLGDAFTAFDIIRRVLTRNDSGSAS